MMAFAYRAREPETVLSGWRYSGRFPSCQRENRNPIFALRQGDIECGEPALGGIDEQDEIPALADGRGRPFHGDGGSGAAAGDEPGDDEDEAEGEQEEKFSHLGTVSGVSAGLQLARQVPFARSHADWINAATHGTRIVDVDGNPSFS